MDKNRAKWCKNAFFHINSFELILETNMKFLHIKNAVKNPF